MSNNRREALGNPILNAMGNDNFFPVHALPLLCGGYGQKSPIK